MKGRGLVKTRPPWRTGSATGQTLGRARAAPVPALPAPPARPPELRSPRLLPAPPRWRRPPHFAVGLVLPLADALGRAAAAAGVGAVTLGAGTAAAAAGLTRALARPVPLTGAPASDRPGIGVALAPAAWPSERMPEPCEPPRASAFAAARHESNRATAGSRYRGGLSVSMLTP